LCKKGEKKGVRCQRQKKFEPSSKQERGEGKFTLLSKKHSNLSERSKGSRHKGG